MNQLDWDKRGLRMDRPATIFVSALLVVWLMPTCGGCAEAPAPRVLNNLVTELLNVPQPGRMSRVFEQPREGFVWVQLRPQQEAPLAGMPVVRIGSQPVVLRRCGDNYEGFQRLVAGVHRLQLGQDVGRVVVNAVGDLSYMTYGNGPWMPETGTYSWEWLRAHVLDSYNIIVGTPGEGEQDIKEWTAEGKQWMTHRNLPLEAKTADEVTNFFVGQPGMQHPLMSGFWGDEFLPFGGEMEARLYPLFSEAMRRLRADPRFKSRRIYAYTGSQVSPAMYDFVKAVVESDYRLAREWYCIERPESSALNGHFGPQWELANRQQWQQGHPEAGNYRLVVMSLLCQPPESCDQYPNANFNVFLDLQMQYLATAEAFQGTRGLQGYYSLYCGEEQTRLFARLLRHYALEGRTERFLSDPYDLTHLQNPDFAHGTEGWTIKPAQVEPPSVAGREAPGFGQLQGRIEKTGGVGDKAMWTKRSAQAMNVAVQQVNNLQPGRLYTLRFITGDYQDLIQGKDRIEKHAVSARLDDVEVLPEHTFQAQSCCHPGYTFGPFNNSNLYRSNYHQILFRAQRMSSRLTLSDWATESAPAGPEGQELIWNFVQIQPYFGE
jgi:hypothetical protein